MNLAGYTDDDIRRVDAQLRILTRFAVCEPESRFLSEARAFLAAELAARDDLRSSKTAQSPIRAKA